MSLAKNVGSTDRNIRMALAGVLVVVGVLFSQWILSLVGLVLLITAWTGVCLAYIPFKINTNKFDYD